MGSEKKRFSFVPMTREELEEVGMLSSSKVQHKKRLEHCPSNATRRPLSTLQQYNFNSKSGPNQTKNNSKKLHTDNPMGLKKTEFPKKQSLRKVLFKKCEIPPKAKQNIEAMQYNIDNSPLMPMEDVEKFLRKKSIMIDSFAEETPASNENHSPVSVPDVQKRMQSMSPSTSGTTSFTGISETALTESSGRRNLNGNFSNEAAFALSRCQKLVQIHMKEKEEFKMLETSFLSFKASYKERESEIDKIVKEIEQVFKQEQMSEKFFYDSERLNKSPISSQSASGRTSIRLSSNKAFKLRVGVLKKNFESEKTPKTKKAQNMYNGLRQRFEMLNTPKFEKEDPSCQKSTDKCNISQKLQEQCLSLYETPHHS